MTTLTLFGLFSGILAITSGVTIVLYWWDKRAATGDQRRIPERRLHLWALAGGWPGAFYARGKFRHKTQKQPFGMILWATAIGNVVIWYLIWSTLG